MSNLSTKAPRSQGPLQPLVVSAHEQRVRAAARRRILAGSGGKWADHALLIFQGFVMSRMVPKTQ